MSLAAALGIIPWRPLIPEEPAFRADFPGFSSGVGGLAPGPVCRGLEPLPAQEAPAGDELEQYLAMRKRNADDTLLPIGQREAAILEMVAPLDRAAQSATETAQKEARWRQAIDLLDEFNAQNPGHPRSREFQLQAGVYRWAQGQSERDSWDLNPADARARAARRRGA